MNTSARFGRGTSRPGEARAIAAHFWELRPLGVVLRSVQDDMMLSEEFVGIGSKIAAEYSEDLSEAGKRAKQRDLAAGKHLGGPGCDGYRMIPRHDDTGRVIGREFGFDPSRAEVILCACTAAARGMADGIIARRLNADGLRTRNDRPFTRRAVQNMVTNPFYAGRIAYKRGTPDEKIVVGHHLPSSTPRCSTRSSGSVPPAITPSPARRPSAVPPRTMPSPA